MTTYSYKSGDPKYNAQRNLEGKTHYVDNDTLKFHHSRIVASHDEQNGLLFWIIESCAMNYENTKRGFRYVIFDIYGNVVSRPDLEACFKTSDKARKAMYEVLKGLDGVSLAYTAIDNQELAYAREIKYAREDLARLINKAA